MSISIQQKSMYVGCQMIFGEPPCGSEDIRLLERHIYTCDYKYKLNICS